MNKKLAKSIALIIIHIILATLIVVVSKYTFIETEISPFFLLFLRNLVSFIILFPIIFPVFKKTYKTHNYKVSSMRSITGISAIALWSYSYSNIPLSTATTLMFVTPIITLILASFYLKERISATRIIVILLGFLGVLIALRPTFGEKNIFYILILVAAFLWSLSNISRKVSSNTNNVNTWLCYYSLWSLCLTFIFAIPFFAKITLVALPLIIIAGVLTAFTSVMSFNTYKHNDVSLVQSFDFLRLIFASLADIFIFHQTLNSGIFIGSFIIICCVLWLVIRESRKLKSITKESSII